MSHISKEEVERIKWFHSIDFGGTFSKSWVYKDTYGLITTYIQFIIFRKDSN